MQYRDTIIELEILHKQLQNTEIDLAAPTNGAGVTGARGARQLAVLAS